MAGTVESESLPNELYDMKLRSISILRLILPPGVRGFTTLTRPREVTLFISSSSVCSSSYAPSLKTLLAMRHVWRTFVVHTCQSSQQDHHDSVYQPLDRKAVGALALVAADLRHRKEVD